MRILSRIAAIILLGLLSINPANAVVIWDPEPTPITFAPEFEFDLVDGTGQRCSGPASETCELILTRLVLSSGFGDGSFVRSSGQRVSAGANLTSAATFLRFEGGRQIWSYSWTLTNTSPVE